VCGGPIPEFNDPARPSEPSRERPLGPEERRVHPGLSLEVREEGERRTVVLAGELDLATAFDLEALTSTLCVQAREIVLDLRGLSFMDSTGLQVMLRARDMCAERDCGFFLIAGPPAVQRLFELTGLTDLLPFVEPPG
jgi:stage II sporulation protein AA (anti-sigma F factor antagonist)